VPTIQRQEINRASIISSLFAGKPVREVIKSCKIKRSRVLAKIWTSSSSGWTPLNYFVWGVSVLDVNKSPQNTSDSLVHKIKEVIGSLERDTVDRACKLFRSKTH
jgi:hypothetical protein